MLHRAEKAIYDGPISMLFGSILSSPGVLVAPIAGFSPSSARRIRGARGNPISANAPTDKVRRVIMIAPPKALSQVLLTEVLGVANRRGQSEKLWRSVLPTHCVLVSADRSLRLLAEGGVG